MTKLGWFLGVVAVLAVSLAAIDSLLPGGRPAAREAQTIWDTRSVISGLMTYASENCGFFPAHLTDLTRWDGTPIAIPNYPDDAPEFLGGDLARADSYVKSGYRRSYQPFGRTDEIPPTCAQDSVLTYCYVSNPESSQFDSAWVNSLPSWLVQILPFDFDTRRAFAGLANTAISVDLDGLDLSCIDGHLPPDTLYLE